MSFAHVFQDAKAESRHKTQYFEMFAHRSIYHDGWRAVCPFPGTSFKEGGAFFGSLTLTEDMLRELDAKHWELYDLSKDPTETTDLAASNRPKLIEMIALWYMEAGKYNVFPLDSRGTLRFADERPQLTKDRKTYVYYPHTQMIPENVAAKLLNKSHSLTADVEIPKGGAEGVLICHGGNVGGYTLFVKDKKLHYVHNYVGAEEFHVASNVDVPTGKVSLRYEFEKTGEPDLKTGKGAAGKAQLYINKKLVGEMKLPYTVPLALGIGSGIFIGRNSGSPVSALYGPPFEFTGAIHRGDGRHFRQADRGHGGRKARARQGRDGAAVGSNRHGRLRFPPLKREPLLEEELPAANPTVRLIKGARIKFAAGQPTGLHRHPISTVGVVTAGSFHLQLEGQAGSASQNRRQFLRAGRPHHSQIRQRIGERARRDRLLLSRRHEGAPADRNASGRHGQPVGQDVAAAFERIGSAHGL